MQHDVMRLYLDTTGGIAGRHAFFFDSIYATTWLG